MKSIKQQYIDLTEGKMSQANFMRNLRMTMPQYITNVTSFNDSIKILKNKGILTEMSHPGTDTWLDTFKETFPSKYMDGLSSAKIIDIFKGMKPQDASSELKKGINTEMEHTSDPMEARKIALDHLKEDPKYYAKLSKAGLEEQPLNEAKDEKTKWTNTSGKSMYDQFSEINILNSQEALIGIDAEMEKNHELTKEEATKIVIKNLKKNPIYYTAEYMSGVEGYEPEYLGGKSAQPEARQMQYLDKNMGNVVDKKMGMQPVKNVEKAKKDSDKVSDKAYKTSGVSLMSLVAKTVRGVKKMDATGEKMKKVAMKEARLNDFPNETPGKIAQQIMNYVDSNPTLKKYSNEITLQSNPDGFLRYGYWDELPADALRALELQYDVKMDTDFDEDTGRIVFYILTPKHSQSGFRPGVNMGSVMESAEDRLAEQISQYIKETMDGRDNLTDVTGENN